MAEKEREHMKHVDHLNQMHLIHLANQASRHQTELLVIQELKQGEIRDAIQQKKTSVDEAVTEYCQSVTRTFNAEKEVMQLGPFSSDPSLTP